jgi:hypothetical protein
MRVYGYHRIGGVNVPIFTFTNYLVGAGGSELAPIHNVFINVQAKVTPYPFRAQLCCMKFVNFHFAFSF